MNGMSEGHFFDERILVVSLIVFGVTEPGNIF
jgi:hypothetical protein